MTSLHNYIKNQGPILSGELAKTLRETQNISASAARKRLERLRSPIHKLRGFFSDGQVLLYHQSIYGTAEYYQGLYTAIQSSSQRCLAIIEAIDYHHGEINKTDLPNYSISPVNRKSGHMMYSTLVSKMVAANILIAEGEYIVVNPHMASLPDVNYRRCEAVRLAKKLLTNQFSEWIRNTGVVSYERVRLNGNVNGFQYSLTGPSYLSGLVHYRKGSPMPGFLVADVLIGNSTTQESVNFFLKKLTSIQHASPITRLLPVILVDGVEPQAFRRLKSKGVMIATVRELFGENYSELLKSLINIVTNAGAILKRNPDEYVNLISQLKKLVEGKTNNLRGDLFELAVGYYFAKHSQSIDISKRIRVLDEDGSKEVDVLAYFEKSVTAVECKGYNYAVDLDYVEDYLSSKIPFIRKWLMTSQPNKSHRFEIWSTGGFTKDAEIKLKAAKKNTKKYQFDFLGKAEIIAKAQEMNSPKFKEILRDYFHGQIG